MAGSAGQCCSPAELGGLWCGLHRRCTLLGLTLGPTQPSGPLPSSIGVNLGPTCQEGGGHMVCGSQHNSAQGGWWHCLHTQGGKPGRTWRQAEGSSPPKPPGAEPLPIIGRVKGFPEAGGWCEDSSPSTLHAELASRAVSAGSAMWSEGLSNDCSAHIQSVPQKSSSQAHLPAIPCPGSGNAQRHPGRWGVNAREGAPELAPQPLPVTLSL